MLRYGQVAADKPIDEMSGSGAERMGRFQQVHGLKIKNIFFNKYKPLVQFVMGTLKNEVYTLNLSDKQKERAELGSWFRWVPLTGGSGSFYQINEDPE